MAPRVPARARWPRARPRCRGLGGLGLVRRVWIGWLHSLGLGGLGLGVDRRGRVSGRSRSIGRGRLGGGSGAIGSRGVRRLALGRGGDGVDLGGRRRVGGSVLIRGGFRVGDLGRGAISGGRLRGRLRSPGFGVGRRFGRGLLDGLVGDGDRPRGLVRHLRVHRCGRFGVRRGPALLLFGQRSGHSWWWICTRESRTA